MRKRDQLGRRFGHLWAAVTFASVGEGMVFVAFPLLALTITRDPVTIAGVAIADRLPALLIGLPVGALADRVDRRRLLITVTVVRTVVMAAFAAIVISGNVSLFAIFATVFVLGALTISFDVVSAASLPSIVRGDQLVSANARLATAQVAGENVAGEALGGLAFAAARSVPFVGDAVGFLLSSLLLDCAVPTNEPSPNTQSVWSDLWAGVRWLLADRLLRLLFSVIATFAFCQAMVFAVLALYATDRLHLSSSGYGFLLAGGSVASFGASWLAKPLHDRLGTAALIVMAGVAAAVAYPVMGLTRSPVVAGVAIAVESLGVVVCTVAASSLRQRIVPAEMQGRAASAYRTLVVSVTPVGSVAGGLLTAREGTATTLVTAGVVQLAILTVTAPRLVRRLRESGHDRGPEPDDSQLVDMRDALGGAHSPMITVSRRLQEALEESEKAMRPGS